MTTTQEFLDAMRSDADFATVALQLSESEKKRLAELQGMRKTRSILDLAGSLKSPAGKHATLEEMNAWPDAPAKRKR